MAAVSEDNFNNISTKFEGGGEAIAPPVPLNPPAMSLKEMSSF